MLAFLKAFYVQQSIIEHFMCAAAFLSICELL